jgi:hypothetical protein
MICAVAALRPLLLCGPLLLVACGNSADPAPADAGPPADPAQEIGGFDIQLVPAVPASADVAAVPAQTALLGRVRSGAAPALKTWTTTLQEGPCRLEQPKIPFCNPACSEAVCTAAGCVREPEPRSAGTVTVKGLATESGAALLTLPPEAPRFTYLLPTDLRLAYPPFAPGAEVEVAGQGGHLGSFSLRARGITPLELPAGGVPVVRPGMPFTVRWSPGSAAEQARVQLSLDLSFHAGTKGRIECDVPDSGALEISAGMMSQLLALGTAGFPKVVLTRSSVASTSLPAGRVRLTIFCELLHTLMIEGQTSCASDKECPTPQTCDLDHLLCRPPA